MVLLSFALVTGAAGALLWLGTKAIQAATPEKEFVVEEEYVATEPSNPPRDEAGVEPAAQDNDEEDHHLAVGLASLGLATVGALVYPPASIFSACATIYTAFPIYQSAYRSLVEERRVRVSVLDSLAITGGVLTHYYVAGALSTVLYYVSKKVLRKTEDQVKERVVDIFDEQPRSVWVSREGIEIEIPFEQLHEGDIIVVQAGQIVPVDGTVCEGLASVDQHRLTGESQPHEKGVGEKVLATSVVLSGRICITAERAGPHTIASQIAAILSQTGDYRTMLETRGEKMADLTTLPILGLGALAWVTVGTQGAVAVLASNFIESMRLAAPLSMLNYLDIATRMGVLVKDGRALELLNQVDTVVFDKTGTLTMAQPVLDEIYPIDGLDAETLLIFAAAAESRQSHPIARAITQAAQARSLTLPDVDEAHYHVGYGISTVINGRRIRVGSARFVEGEGIAIPSALRDIQERANEQSSSLIYVAVDDTLGGALELRPIPRPEVRQTLAELRALGLSVFIISGDHEAPTRALATELGVDHYFAETLPQQKASLIETMQNEGRKVCFVGDGINDVIALKKAHSSISLSGASTAATDTAQIVLMDGTLAQLPAIFKLVKQFNENVNTGYAINGVAEAICIAGVLLANLSVYSSVVLYNLSLVASVGNAMWPALRKAKSAESNPRQASATREENQYRS